jgi:CRISPR-associated exonuclease Cas4
LTSRATALDATLLSLSALQHYAYCPRQFALIHTEQVWADNFFTAQGNVLHERVDSGLPEQRGNVRSERAVDVSSTLHGIKGKMDLLEIETLSSGALRYFPVEYKRGKPKLADWDRIQLCAQALCLEDMHGVPVTEGAIWYWEIRRRTPVAIDAALRQVTLGVIAAARALLLSQKTPPPTTDKSLCKACSLRDICMPDSFRIDKSERYVLDMLAGQV